MDDFSNIIFFIIIYLSNFVFIHNIIGAFVINKTDYDAYGIKIAMNEHFLVLVENKNDPPNFFIKFAPYNNTQLSLQCSTYNLNTTDSFIYTVVVGKKQNENQTHFYYIFQ